MRLTALAAAVCGGGGAGNLCVELPKATAVRLPSAAELHAAGCCGDMRLEYVSERHSIL
jgi:hypothetical protein